MSFGAFCGYLIVLLWSAAPPRSFVLLLVLLVLLVLVLLLVLLLVAFCGEYEYENRRRSV